MATYANDIQQTTIPLYTFSCMQDAVTGGDGLLLFTVCVFFLFSRSRECVIELSSFSPPPALNGKKKRNLEYKRPTAEGVFCLSRPVFIFFLFPSFLPPTEKRQKKKTPCIACQCQFSVPTTWGHPSIHPLLVRLFHFAPSSRIYSTDIGQPLFSSSSSFPF